MGEIGFGGLFRVVRREPSGEISHDTGFVKNTVTARGVQMFLEGFSGGHHTHGDGPINVPDVAITEATHVSHIALGYLDPQPDSDTYWTADILGGEYAGGGTYARQAVNVAYATALDVADLYDNPAPAAGITYNHANHASRLLFRVSFAAGSFNDTPDPQINQVGLYNASTGVDMLAAANFTAFSVNSLQIVDVYYSIYLTQPTAA